MGAARRMGARGLSTLVVFVIAGLVGRARRRGGPETLVAPAAALELWSWPAARRHRARSVAVLVLVAFLWANCTSPTESWLALIGFHAAASGSRAPADAAGVRLEWIGLAAAAASFANPLAGTRSCSRSSTVHVEQGADLPHHRRVEPLPSRTTGATASAAPVRLATAERVARHPRRARATLRRRRDT